MLVSGAGHDKPGHFEELAVPGDDRGRDVIDTGIVQGMNFDARLCANLARNGDVVGSV